MTHPGLVAPGAIAALALVGLIAPPLLINMANWWEVAAILVGIVLIALEILVIPGFGVAGVLGLLLLFGGLIGTFVPHGSLFPDSPRARNDLLYGVATVVMSVVTSGVAMYFISKNFKSLPLFGKLVLKDPVGNDDDSGQDLLAAMAESTGPVKKGMVGTAITPLRPAGRVELGGGRIIDVVAELGFIPSGAAVKVTSVSEFRIGVERLEA
jgi:membrane-bound serine protease (ClpP class)